MDYTDPSKVVEYITGILLNAADSAKIKTKSNRSQDFNNPPWFNKECVDLKKKVSTLGKQRKRLPNCEITRIELSKVKRKLKATIKGNKAKFKIDLLRNMNLRRKDTKMFWKLLDKLGRKQEKDILKDSISPTKWVDHFQNVSHNPNVNKLLPHNPREEGPMDYSISQEELMLGTYILKQGKSTGYDGISNEMLSCLLKISPELIGKVFNGILHNPTTIKKWQISMITPIYKKGCKLNPDNYRGISLLSCFSKFFLAILNSRLLKFAIENQILSKTQLGFLPGNRTSDALLILHNLVDYYCNKNKKYLYGCFVDFSKAFDSLPRYTLFTKLLKHDISGKFYDCLVNLYTEDQSCIKVKNKITNTFTINQGVKQGCVLSPLLFNIFMSDLPQELEKQENDPIEISPHEFCGGLLWADDLLMLSVRKRTSEYARYFARFLRKKRT